MRADSGGSSEPVARAAGRAWRCRLASQGPSVCDTAPVKCDVSVASPSALPDYLVENELEWAPPRAGYPRCLQDRPWRWGLAILTSGQTSSGRVRPVPLQGGARPCGLPTLTQTPQAGKVS